MTGQGHGEVISKGVPMRSAEVTMSPQRLAAAYPSPLSFARMGVQRLVRDRWRLQCVSLDLDAEGRGEALYQFVGPEKTLHFFVQCKMLPESQQNDRNFALAWDVTAALCEGPWTPRREAHLREEVPKQERGWTDYDTLIICRANRSARLFEHVVQRLTSGLQPDARQISEVGYIMRTTAFIGNGASGTRPYSGYGASHPLRRSHHAQICCAFLLREFVFDLVEHIARSRNPAAARLHPDYKRYLGLGNSTAAGLIRFLYNHPQLVGRWCWNWEAALSLVKAMRPTSASEDYRRFSTLLRKAQRYFSEAGRPSTGVFAPPADIAQELGALADEASRLIETREEGRSFFVDLCDWAQAAAHPETREILNSIMLETYPEITEQFLDAFDLDEGYQVDPLMPVAELRSILKDRYSWAFRWNPLEPSEEHYFWFHSSRAPADARRGYRHINPKLEHENAMETIRQVHRLDRRLAEHAASDPIGKLLLDDPSLRQIVARVQTVANDPYAELHDNPLSQAYSPFPALRLILAFYGMEKFESALPKLVRGALLQGAPIAEDVAAGLEGNWPFPLLPNLTEGRGASAPRTASPRASQAGHGEHDGSSIEFRISEPELAKKIQRALQAGGASLGISTESARSVAFSQALWPEFGLEIFRSTVESCERGGEACIVRSEHALTVIDARGGGAMTAACCAQDIACLNYHDRNLDLSCVLIRNASDLSTLDYFAMRAARAETMGLVLWQTPETSEPLGSMRLILSAFDNDDLWLRSVPVYPPGLGSSQSKPPADTLESLRHFLTEPEHAPIPNIVDMNIHSDARELDGCGHFLLALVKTGRGVETTRVREAALSRFGERPGGKTLNIRGADIRSSIERSRENGFHVRQKDWLRLEEIAERLLIQPAEEATLRDAGFDPAKIF